MNVKELKDLISHLQDDVKVYIEADNGQQPKLSMRIQACITLEEKLPYYAEDLHWEPIGGITLENCKQVRAILIS